MKEIMTILGQWVWKVSPTEEEMVEMIREADTDSDGYLHYKDFINKIKSIR
jgi:Ca2+-binding EF-hand superfamily protein